MMRFKALSSLAVCALVFGAPAVHAAEIARNTLTISGSNLEIPDNTVSTLPDTPSQVQTRFGGKINEEAAKVTGAVVIGELTGPGIPQPIALTTAPGHALHIPALPTGEFRISNVRLARNGELLQKASPDFVVITVEDSLKSEIKVTQLTPADLRARGIQIDARNYDVFEYAFSFNVGDQKITVPFPVAVDTRTRETIPLISENPYSLPPIDEELPRRWTLPTIIPTSFEEVGTPEKPTQGPVVSDSSPQRRRIPAALVIPSNLAVLHQFFAVALIVNNASEGTDVRLTDVSGSMVNLSPNLRIAGTQPRVAFGQPVPVIGPNNVTVLIAGAQGSAEWTVEGLKAGTYQLEVDLRATYKVANQPDIQLQARPKAAIVIHDPRFNVSFSHPEVVRAGENYSAFAFITNTSATFQHLELSTPGLPSCPAGGNVCAVATVNASLDLDPGETEIVEYKLQSQVNGQVFAAAADVDGAAGASAGVRLLMDVLVEGIPQSPATLVLPYYAKYIDQQLVTAQLRLLGQGYSLATAPLTTSTAKLPRVIKSDVFTRAVDIARAGQKIFIANDSPRVKRDALANLMLDAMGNGQALEEWDQLRRKVTAGRTAGAALFNALATNHDQPSAVVDTFASATAHRAPYLFAYIHGAGATQSHAVSVKNGNGYVSAIANEQVADWSRAVPFADISRLDVAGSWGEALVVGRWSDDLTISMTPVAGASGPVTLEMLIPDANGGLRRISRTFNPAANETLTISPLRGNAKVTVLSSIAPDLSVDTETVSVRPVELLAARQDLYLDKSGRKVSVLFSRPIADEATLRDRFTAKVFFARDGESLNFARAIFGAARQADGSIVNLAFDQVLTKATGITYQLTAAGIDDPLSTAAVGGSVAPVIENESPAGIILGTVIGANGAAVDKAAIELDAATQQFDTTTPEGKFLFEHVSNDPATQTGAYTLTATAAGRETSRVGAIRQNGEVQRLTLQFLGRGSVSGVVRYSDTGAVISGAKVVVGSTMHDEVRKTTTAADGSYLVDDLPVGPITVSAIDAAGRVSYAATEIRVPGERVTQNVSIYRNATPRYGTVKGTVVRSDDQKPVANALVAVYTSNYAVGQMRTDAEGRFEFASVPAGLVTLQAVEWTISREASYMNFELLADTTATKVLPLAIESTSTRVVVSGTVSRRLANGSSEPVSGALVQIQGMPSVIADATGNYVYEAVPTSFSGRLIRAHDPSTGRSASATLQLPSSGPVDLVIIGESSSYGTGTIRVKLTDAAGLPVSNYQILTPDLDVQPEIVAKPDGVYELKDVRSKLYLRIVAAPTASSGHGDQYVIGSTQVEFPDHIAPLSLRLPGQGKVRTSLVAQTGNGGTTTPLGKVDLSYKVWDIAGQDVMLKTVSQMTDASGVALISNVPASQNISVSADLPAHGYDAASTRIDYDGQLRDVELSFDSLSTVRGTVVGIDGVTPTPGARVRVIDGRQDQGWSLTDVNGAFEFRNVASDATVRVIAEITENGVFRTGYATAQTPEHGGLVENLTVELRRQGRVAGRFIDANGVAIPRAAFWARELDFPGRTFGSREAPLTADEAGQFTLGNLFVGPVRIAAYHPTRPNEDGAQTRVVEHEGHEITDWVITLGAEGSGNVEVRVVDPVAAFEPVPNANVTLMYAVGNNASVIDVASTDGEGLATFTYVPVGVQYVVVASSSANGRSGSVGAKVITKNETVKVQVDLTFVGSASGQVVESATDASGVPGIPVTLKGVGYSTRTSSSGDAGSIGRFTFGGVREGSFDLEARDPISQRRATAQRSISTVRPEANDISLVLEPIFALKVKVVERDDTGALTTTPGPLVEMKIGQRCRTSQNVRFCDWNRTLQGNDFEVAGMFQSETYYISIRELGGENRVAHHEGNYPAGANTALSLALPVFGNVNVAVSQNSTSLAGASVTLNARDYSANVFTDASGLARFVRVPLGDVSTQASFEAAEGARVTGSAVGTLSTQSQPLTLAVSLSQLGRLSGQVVAESGEPSAQTIVTLTASGLRQTTTDANGNYLFEGVPINTNGSVRAYAADGVSLGDTEPMPALSNGGSAVVNLRLDASRPHLVGFYPADGANEIAPDSAIRLVFDENVSVSSSQATLRDGASVVNCDVSATQQQQDGTFLVTVTPRPVGGQTYPLKSYTLYSVTVSAAIADANGNTLEAARGFSFITTDYAGPKVSSISPAATDVLLPATTLEIRFSEPINPAVGAWDVRLNRIVGGSAITQQVNTLFDSTGTTLYLSAHPANPILENSVYRLDINAARDLQSNPLQAAVSRTYLTKDDTKPGIVLTAPVAAGEQLVSRTRYETKPTTTDTDIARVEYETSNGQIYVASATPWTYAFLAPEVTAQNTPFWIKAIAYDASGNASVPSQLDLLVKPDLAPKDVVLALTPAADFYAPRNVTANVRWNDDSALVTARVTVTGTRINGQAFSLVQTAEVRTSDSTWGNHNFTLAIPGDITPGSSLTFTARITDSRSQATDAASVMAQALADTTLPVIVSSDPLDGKSYSNGASYKVSVVARDGESGIKEVRFQIENSTQTLTTGTAQPDGATKYTSSNIVVPLKNFDTNIPVVITVTDHQGNATTSRFEVVYIGRNDPTAPRGIWQNPVDKGLLPAGRTLPLTLRARVINHIEADGVQFVIDGAAPINATRVGTTDVYTAAINYTVPAAGAFIEFKAKYRGVLDGLAQDAESSVLVSSVAIDEVIEGGLVSILASNAATYTDKSVLVLGPAGVLVPHIPLQLKNLVVINGGKVNSLKTTTTKEAKIALNVTETLYVDYDSSINANETGYLGAWVANDDGSGVTNASPRGMTVGLSNTTGADALASASHGGVGGDVFNAVTNATYGDFAAPTELGSGGGGNATGTIKGATGGGAIRINQNLTAESLSRVVIAGSLNANGGSATATSVGGAGSGGSIFIKTRDFFGRVGRISAVGGDDNATVRETRGGGGGRITIDALNRFETDDTATQFSARGGRNVGSDTIADYIDGGAGTVFIRHAELSRGHLLVSSLNPDGLANQHLAAATVIPEYALGLDALSVRKSAVARFDGALLIGEAVDEGARSLASVDSTARIVLQSERPLLTVSTTPESGSTLPQGAKLVVGFNASSATEIMRVVMDLGAISTATALPLPSITTNASGNAAITLADDVVVGSTHKLTVVARDRASRDAVITDKTFTIVANRKPEFISANLSVSAPSTLPDELYAGATVSLVVKATDDLGVTSLKLISSIGNASPVTQTKTFTATPAVEHTFTLSIPKETVSGSLVTLKLALNDGFTGRVDEEMTLQPLTVKRDSAGPVVTITAPAEGASYDEGSTSKIQLRATIVDAEVGVASATATMQGEATVQMVRGAGDTWSADLSIPYIGDSTEPRSITVVGYDYQSNPSTAVRNVSIKPNTSAQKPVITWLCSPDGASYPVGYEPQLKARITSPFALQVSFIFPDGLTVPGIKATGTNDWTPNFTGVTPYKVSGSDGTSLIFTVTATGGGVPEEAKATARVLTTANVFTTDTFISASNTTYDNQTIIIQGGITTIDGKHRFSNVIVLHQGTIKHSAGLALNIDETETLYVACGGVIDANGRGYTANVTYPGATSAGNVSGGSHIGVGGLSNQPTGSTYGSVYSPFEAGAGGGNGGIGGGVVRIDADRVVIHGTVRANGATATNIAGAGGSVDIIANRFEGSGLVQALGGDTGSWGTGGGGAIAITYNSTSSDSLLPTASVRAGALSSRSQWGGSGTVLWKKPGITYGDLYVDNGGRVGQATVLPSLGSGLALEGSGAGTIIHNRVVPDYFVDHWVEVRTSSGHLKGTWRIESITPSQMILKANNGTDVPSVSKDDAWQGVYRFDHLYVANGELVLSDDPIRIGVNGVVELTGPSAAGKFLELDDTVVGDVVTVAGNVSVPKVSAQNLTVKPNSRLTHPIGGRLDVEVAQTITVEALGSIDADGRGYPASVTHPGSTLGGNASGGSHIGVGGLTNAPTGTTYGSIYRPSEAGSGAAGGGLGGGVLRLDAERITVAGRISANGEGVGASNQGGAGGSVWITADVVDGSGTIQTRGGDTGSWGTGGGGAIMVDLALEPNPAIAFPRFVIEAGDLSSRSQWGGSGSALLRTPSLRYGKLIVDNDGKVGQATQLPALGGGIAQGGSSGDLLFVQAAVPTYFEGHFVEVRDPSGQLKGTWPIESIEGTTLHLGSDQNVAPNVTENDLWQGVYRFDQISVQRTETINSVDPIRLGVDGVVLLEGPTTSGNYLQINNEIVGRTVSVTGNVSVSRIVADSLTVTPTGVLSHKQGDSLHLQISGAVTIAAGGRVDVNRSGFGNQGTYTGAVIPEEWGGAGHMGTGAAYNYRGGSSYGSVKKPIEPGAGSGGTGGVSGGGVVRIEAGHLMLGGSILAEGSPSVGWNGAGAGGSIWITASQIEGAGLISANGGVSSAFGTGGGGAIAVEYDSTPTGAAFPRMTANAGTVSGNARYGSAGTVYVQKAASPYGELRVDNAGITGKKTMLPSLGKHQVRGVAADGKVDLVTEWIPAWFVGHSVEILDSSNVRKGAGRVTSISHGARVLSSRELPVYTSDSIAYEGYFIVSETPFSTRFGGGLSSAELIFPARYVNGVWQYDNNNNGFTAFTPLPSDRIIATFVKDTSTITSFTPVVCPASGCVAMNGLGTMQFVSGTVAVNALMPGASGTGAAEFVISPAVDRAVAASYGNPVTIAVEIDGAVEIAPGDFIQGVHQFDAVIESNGGDVDSTDPIRAPGFAPLAAPPTSSSGFLIEAKLGAESIHSSSSSPTPTLRP